MSLEASIQENTAAIRELIATLAKGITPTANQVAAVVSEGKAQKVAPKAEPVVESTPPASEPESFPGATEYTYQDAAAAITKLSRVKGRDAAVSLLYRFKASKLPDVQPDQYAEIIEAANAAMGA